MVIRYGFTYLWVVGDLQWPDNDFCCKLLLSLTHSHWNLGSGILEGDAPFLCLEVESKPHA